MKHKNKKAIKVLFMLIVIMVFFAYGVGVGEYQWPPYDVIRSVARAFSEGITGVRSSVKKDGASYTIQSWRLSYFDLDDQGTLAWKEGMPYRNERIFYFDRQIEPQKTGIVIMDPWIDAPSEHLNLYYTPIIEERIIPVVEKSLELGHPILVLTNSPRQRAYSTQVHPFFETLVKEDLVVLLYHEDFDDRKFANYLKSQGIHSLIYTGFASNMCIIGRQMGIIPMHNLGFQIYFIPEASAAVEYDLSWETGDIHEKTSTIIAQWMAEIININEFINIKK